MDTIKTSSEDLDGIVASRVGVKSIGKSRTGWSGDKVTDRKGWEGEDRKCEEEDGN